jgi:D-sedoheptulose 7-phosphate isomerase
VDPSGSVAAALAAFARRDAPTRALAQRADAIAAACEAMAGAFQRGGRLITFGSGIGATDAAHVAVEFMHPVIVGKRALPALAAEAASLPLLGRRDDIALGFAYGTDTSDVRAAFTATRERGLLTIALVAAESDTEAIGAEHVLVAGASDPRIAKEMQVTMYHVLWELTHVFLERTSVPTSVATR